MLKKSLFMGCLVGILTSLNAQTTETFETETNGSTSFTDNGQVFNITSQAQGPFKIQGLYPGTGWNGTATDNKYIDNDGFATTLPVQFTISSSGAVPFKLISMWLYLSNASLDVNVTGSVTIVGKLAGVTKYTATASSGFNTNWGVSNGFSLINLSTFGGTNNSNTAIDQIIISTGGDFHYVSLDAFTWSTVPNITATTSQINLACNNVCNGSATVTPSGGISPYTYSWSPSGGSSATAFSLCAGIYTCTITDNASNSITKSITITQPAAISVTAASQTNIACNGGATGAASISSPTGGTPGYTYNWTPGNPTGDGTVSVTGLTVGTWTCTVTDANGCTKAQSFTVTQPTAISTATGSQTNVSCNGGTNGSASVSPSGGTPSYTYSWSPSGGTGATATGLAAGNYTVTVTDANSCTATRNFTLTQPSAINTSSGSQTNVSCNGETNGSASVSPSGGTGAYTYSWSPSGGTGATATGLAAGNYTVTVTDANSCTATRNYIITQPSAINTSSGSQTNVSCNGGTNGSASVSPSGGTPGYTYSWSPSGGTGATATGLAAGNYTVTVTDANSCTATRNYIITQPSAINTSSGSQTNVSCNGGTNGSASVSPSGGTPSYTYSWSPSGGTGATATGLAAGNYTVTVTDANSCTATRNFTITQPAAINATVTQSSGVLTASQTGATYQWYNCSNNSPVGTNSNTFTPTQSGNYKVDITAGSCTVTSTCVTVTTLGINDFEKNTKFVIYPNPTSNIVHINSEIDGNIQIVNQLGQTVKTFKVKANEINTLNTENLTDGVYFVKVSNQTKSYKLIIKK